MRRINIFLAGLFLSMLFIASCTKEYSEESGVPLGSGGTGGSSSGTAIYTLDGTPGACTTPLITGTYQAGRALDINNTIVLTVNVTTVGTYTISTGSANGIAFSGTGTFTSTGTQIIILNGSGTPVAAGTNTFAPGTAGCSFQITTTPVVVGPVAIGTLDCATATLAGVYTQSIALTGTNKVTIPVNVTTAGSYTVNTTATNGIAFSGSGNLALGAQTIVLTGSGTPTNDGAILIPISLGTSNCNFSITFLPAPPPAAYTFTGAPGLCNPITVNGTYVAGTPLGAASAATIEVNVTTVGLYTITTNSVNGMIFSISGQFSTTGPQSITLAGSGTPTSAGTNSFTVGTAGCTFDVVVTAPSSPCTGLVPNKFVMASQFSLTGFSFGTSLGSQYQISIQQGAVNLNVIFTGGTVPTPGTYTIGTAVTISCLNSDFTNWTATSGSVYVSESAGSTIVEFCNVAFNGVPLLGGSIGSTGEARLEP